MRAAIRNKLEAIKNPVKSIKSTPKAKPNQPFLLTDPFTQDCAKDIAAGKAFTFQQLSERTGWSVNFLWKKFHKNPHVWRKGIDFLIPESLLNRFILENFNGSIQQQKLKEKLSQLQLTNT